MRKSAVLLFTALLVVGLLGVVGCGGTKTASNPLQQLAKKGATISTPQGNLNVSTKVTEEDIGVPFYPGAKMDEGSAGMITKNGKGEVLGAVRLFTSDPPSKVIPWYRDKLSGKPNFNEMASTPEQALFAFQDGDVTKTVSIGVATVDNPGKTEIGIASTPGSAVPPVQK